jgi:large subunit ribosomal protein LP0
MGKNTMMRKCIRDYCERIGDDSWMVMAGAYTRSH